MKNKRIVILGTSGSGKSTLARKLSAKHGIPHIELDVLYWNPGWKETPMPVFLQKIEEAIAQNRNWVICGNYNIAKKLTLPVATNIIWLDTPIYINLWRALKRSVVRWLKKEETFAGCPETFSHIFLNKQSLLLWIWQTHKSRREAYNKLLVKENFPKAEIYRVRNGKEYGQVLADV